METAHDQLSLYLHIPFCSVRCSYCAFNIYTNLERLIPAYSEALRCELRWLGPAADKPLHTIYFGGGTPSLLPPDQVASILAVCRQSFQVTQDVEITLEANPESLDQRYFEQIRAAGVNRLSIGMQSALAHELKLFRRQHRLEATKQTVDAARRAGFANISLDLIYGVPNQTLDDWRASLQAAMTLAPDHLSLYALQVESGTALAHWVAHGRVPQPDDDLTADMYELTDALLPAAGFAQYEISTWARPGYECRHNLQYWRNAPYLGVGCGAHGYANGLRYQVVRAPQAYIARMSAQTEAQSFPLTAAVETHEVIDLDQAMDETMMTGLRLLQAGISRRDFEARFGRPVEAVYGATLERLAALDMLSVDTEHIRLTKRARLISNQALVSFIRG